MAEPTIVAIATPPGRGAIGVVRLSGTQSHEIVKRLTQRTSAFEARYATLSKIYDGDELLDEGLVILFPEGASYTGEESVEIYAHGSPYVLERLVACCLETGAQAAGPGEFTQRAFLNGRIDLSQA